ncbi:MAG: 16S rRNA (cytosine(1402)-N(4))-methyltransferase RsmH [Clostridiales bacterium]|nr:16S rRNA (cytosine(1402)-N(4))-methyltransferase RsmH [Clostridiales bacterium]
MNAESTPGVPEPQHQRRIRYKGTHPKTYKEKYKELQPQKYAQDVAQVIRKGRTPAGIHLPICVNEILEFLQIIPGQTGLDATLGYGGHALEMLKALQPGGRLYGIDVDEIELTRTKKRLEGLGHVSDVLQVRHMNFSQIDQLVMEAGQPFDFVLADLGVASMQIDNPQRGFSFKLQGPLDLRLNPGKGISAAERLKAMSLAELEGMLVENADEPFAAPIARGIFSNIKKGSGITTTAQLRNIITEALKPIPNISKEDIKKSCQRCFQALRIDVNREFESLYKFLEKLPDALTSGGRVAILSFHSGEDRLVKKSFQHFFREGIYREVAPGPVRPSSEECFANSRARSAKLRWAVKA